MPAIAAVRLNLALIQLDTGRPALARPQIAAAAERFAAVGRRFLLTLCALLEATCDAAEGDRPACDRHRAEARALQVETGFLDYDLPQTAERLARFAADHGWADVAAESLAWAAELWTALDRPEDAARVGSASP